ncbi:hypothetical protein ACFQVB_27255 [Paraburkholderia humisilvae]
MLREVNASLARDPLASPDFDCAMKYALQCTYHYRLGELTFSLPCCAVTRRIGNARQTVLALRPPAWWKRIGHSPVYRRLHIDVRPDATTLRFTPIERTALAPRGKRWTLLLTQNQKLILALSPDVPSEAPSASTGRAFLRRITRWLRRKPESDVRDAR